MTPVLNGKGLLLEASNPKIEDKQVPGINYLESQPSYGGFFTTPSEKYFGTSVVKLDRISNLGFFVKMTEIFEVSPPTS